MSETKTLNLMNLKITLATREIARFVMQIAINQNHEAISLRNVKSASRSFLDELYILSVNNNINLVEVPKTIEPLLEIIKKSHKEQKLYAPKIKVRLSNAVFA